jgi:hypothetical protein
MAKLPPVNTKTTDRDVELGRYQQVLNAYLAHPGADPTPPERLDASILALAHGAVSEAAAPLQQKSLRTRRRWPYALAASLATIGFAALLARTTLRDSAPYERPAARTQVVQESAAAADVPPQADASAQADAAQAVPQVAPPIPQPTDASSVPLDPNIAAQMAKNPSRSQTPAPDQRAENADKQEQAAAKTDALAADADAMVDQGTLAEMPSAPAKNSESRIVRAELPAAATQAEAGLATASAPAEVPAVSAPAVPEPQATVESAESKRLEDVTMTGIRVRRADAETAQPALAVASERDTQAAPALTSPAPEPTLRSNSAPLLAGSNAEEELGRAGAMMTEATKPEPVADSAVDKTLEKKDAEASAQAHEKLFAEIRALRKRGDQQAARAMLERFIKAYPQVELPKDLQEFSKVQK